ncbi:MAG: ATP-binding domain-containing protein, partial [Firmicutes bacterium]|nr:ATP-binding domain-containing protein [Bacillota bacterium]
RRLFGLLRWVRAASVPDPTQATVQLATIHKAKGLEWPHVVVLDDLAPLTPDLAPDDHHLWYVAATRATALLGLPTEAAHRIMSGRKEAQSG